MIHITLRRKTLVLIIAIAIFVVIAAAMAIAYGSKISETQQPDGVIEVSEVQMSSRHKGRVLEICVEVGDYVNVGDTLAVIEVAEDDRGSGKNAKNAAMDDKIHNFYLILQRAKAGLDIAEESYHNMQKLYEEGTITEEVLNEALTNYKLMEGQVMAVQNTLRLMQYDNGESVVVAQVEGEIADIYLPVGGAVQNGTPIVNVYIMDDLWGAFYVDEAEMKNLKLGSVINAYVPAFNKEVKMQVYDIEDTGEDAFVGEIDNSEWIYAHDAVRIKARPVDYIEGLRPGMVLRVRD